MKNNSNIYDIDGELIRSIDDTHEWTIEEVQKKIEDYRKKYEDLPENDPKRAVYTTYIRNLNNLLIALWSSNHSSTQTTQEAINKAIEELKTDLNDDTETGSDTEDEIQGTTPTNNEGITDEEFGDDEVIGREFGNIHEERSVTQDNLLVERDGVTTDMDEYVDFEEV